MEPQARAQASGAGRLDQIGSVRKEWALPILFIYFLALCFYDNKLKKLKQHSSVK
jgi:hypothetical protein